MNLAVRQILATGTGITLSTLMGAAVWAQNQTPTADNGGQPQHKIQLVQAQAQLNSTLDTKKAKQGEPVTAKLEENVQIPDAQELPKNTVLEGHVDQVQASDHKSDSMVVVTFDKAKLKDGQELPIKATIIAVSEPVMMQQQNGGGGAPASSGAPMANSAASGGGAPSGGSTSSSGSSPSAPSAQPMSVPQSGSGSAQGSPQNGVPDVTLKSDIHEHNSATFMSKGKNVHVPDGTQLDVALAVIPAGVKLQ
ncbi:MAG TPA: hypothetical protein VHZ25_14585 [Acidobacteriaceae bacterium]|jgi:hypothetical protein|nr:hypothetical protein [Acidobacteriaceae bacterium]